MKLDILELVENLTSSIEDVSQAKNNVEVCEKIETLLKGLTQSDFASLFIFDKERQMLYKKNEQMLELSMIDVEGCIGKAFLTKSPAIYNHLASDKDYVQVYDNPYNHKLKSQMLMPVLEKGELVGIVRVSRAINGNKKRYTKTDLEALTSIESYLIKIIRTISSNKTLPTCEESTEKIQHKLETIQQNDETVDSKNMLLFLSNTVHDIRTPANSLYGFLELLEEQIEDKRLKEFVINAKESAKFINTLTDTILTKSKNRYEASTSKPTLVNSVKFLSETTNIFAARMLEKNINYFIFIDPNMPKEINIDTLKLKRVLINLIGNAYKFTPIGHRIDVYIGYDKESKKMSLSVKDTGIGIEDEDQKKLFKAFSQATDNTELEYGGTGLGLAISAEYVADLGGELKLKSRINEGTEFYFDIPLDIVDKTASYEKFFNLEKKIVILTDDVDSVSAEYIRSYIIKLGMPSDRIYISNKVKKGTTHLICFEHKMTPEILSLAKEGQFELLLIEEKLFSLLNNSETNSFQIVSENTYYGDAIHSTIFSGNKVKVLLVDDNKINISLLESMLNTEYVDVQACMDGVSGLQMLKDAVKSGEMFDVVYLDEHMPGMLGSELLEEFRVYESLKQLTPIYAVSISGDPYISGAEQNMFDMFVKKPFNKNEVRNVIEHLKNTKK
jgi:signal transduction histidine kinase